MLPDLHIGFSRGRSGGLVFPSLSFRLPQISYFPLSLKCFSSDSDNCPRCGGQTPASGPPPAEGRSRPSNSPPFPPSSFVLLSFTWVSMFFSTGHGKTREFQKNIYFCLIDYAKAFDCVDHNNLWKILKEMGIPDHLTCLLRNLYAGQEATVRTGHGMIDWFQLGKGVRQGCILSPCFFNLYAEYIMRNAGLEEAQAGIKIARRNINNSDMHMTPPLWQKEKRN